MLRVNRTLQVLWIGRNKLDDASALAIAEVRLLAIVFLSVLWILLSVDTGFGAIPAHTRRDCGETKADLWDERGGVYVTHLMKSITIDLFSFLSQLFRPRASSSQMTQPDVCRTCSVVLNAFMIWVIEMRGWLLLIAPSARRRRRKRQRSPQQQSLVYVWDTCIIFM